MSLDFTVNWNSTKNQTETNCLKSEIVRISDTYCSFSSRYKLLIFDYFLSQVCVASTTFETSTFFAYDSWPKNRKSFSAMIGREAFTILEMSKDSSDANSFSDKILRMMSSVPGLVSKHIFVHPYSPSWGLSLLLGC